MQLDEMPERWQERVAAYVAEIRPDGRPGLSAYDFPSGLRIHFLDGSIAEFKFAFALTEGWETTVFTEHCGHHIFPSDGLRIESIPNT